MVSTQLIEAGVDIDFPLLLREMAPLESIVQAAGRCNREGLLNTLDRPGGEVIVFRGPHDISKFPDHWYRTGTGVIQASLNAGCIPDIHHPEELTRYFRTLYASGNLDQHGIVAARESARFADTSAAYHLIDDDTISLLVTAWEPHRSEVLNLLESLRKGFTRNIYRKLQRFAVNVYRHDFNQMRATITPDYLPGINLCALPYSDEIGLVPDAQSGALVF